MDVMMMRRMAVMSSLHLGTAMSGNTEYSTAIAHISDAKGTCPIHSLKINLPYRESGYTETKFTHCGKNLFDYRTIETQNITIVDNDDSEFYGTLLSLLNDHHPNNGGVFNCNGIEKFSWAMDAYNEANVSDAGNGMQPVLRYNDGSDKNTVLFTYPNSTLTWLNKTLASSNYQVPKFIFFSYYSAQQNVWHVRRFQIELGNQSTDFEKYKGSQYTINLPTAIYGGVADPVTGSILSEYAADGTKLQTPVEYQITPIQLSMFAGVNNIWSTDGTVTVKYYTK